MLATQFSIVFIKDTKKKGVFLDLWVFCSLTVGGDTQKARGFDTNLISKIQCQTQGIEAWTEISTCCGDCYLHIKPLYSRKYIVWHILFF